MTSQTGQQIITIHILPNISKSKDNQAIKFGELIDYSMRIFVPQKSCRKWGREASSRSFCVFKKALCKVKAV